MIINCLLIATIITKEDIIIYDFNYCQKLCLLFTKKNPKTNFAITIIITIISNNIIFIIKVSVIFFLLYFRCINYYPYFFICYLRISYLRNLCRLIFQNFINLFKKNHRFLQVKWYCLYFAINIAVITIPFAFLKIFTTIWKDPWICQIFFLWELYWIFFQNLSSRIRYFIDCYYFSYYFLHI